MGVTETTLRKHEKKGRIAPLPGGGYDTEQVKAALDAARDPARTQVRTGRAEPTAAIRSEADAADALTFLQQVMAEEGLGTLGPYDMARTVDLILKARERQLAMDIKAGKLLAVEDVKRTREDDNRQVRSAFLALTSRIRQLLGHLTTHDISIIDRAVRDVLSDLGSGGDGLLGGEGGPNPAPETPPL